MDDDKTDAFYAWYPCHPWLPSSLRSWRLCGENEFKIDFSEENSGHAEGRQNP